MDDDVFSTFQSQLDEAKKAFRERLKELRRHKKYDYNQTELAKLKPLSVTKGAVSKWENGEGLPTGEKLFGIHKIFDVSLDYLFGISNEPPAYLSPKSDTTTALPFQLDPLYHFLWSEDYTEAVETSAKVIWVATPDFMWEHESDRWGKTIFSNITKGQGVRYYYLYKSGNDNEGKMLVFKNRLQRAMDDNWRNVVHFVAASSDEFPLWAEHVLYDAFGGSPRCIMVLPHGYGERNVGGYNLEFTWAMTYNFAIWFSTLWKNNLEDDAQKDWAISWPTEYTPASSDDHAGWDSTSD